MIDKYLYSKFDINLFFCKFRFEIYIYVYDRISFAVCILIRFFLYIYSILLSSSCFISAFLYSSFIYFNISHIRGAKYKKNEASRVVDNKNEKSSPVTFHNPTLFYPLWEMFNLNMYKIRVEGWA